MTKPIWIIHSFHFARNTHSFVPTHLNKSKNRESKQTKLIQWFGSVFQYSIGYLGLIFDKTKYFLFDSVFALKTNENRTEPRYIPFKKTKNLHSATIHPPIYSPIYALSISFICAALLWQHSLSLAPPSHQQYHRRLFRRSATAVISFATLVSLCPSCVFLPLYWTLAQFLLLQNRLVQFGHQLGPKPEEPNRLSPRRARLHTIDTF